MKPQYVNIILTFAILPFLLIMAKVYNIIEAERLAIALLIAFSISFIVLVYSKHFKNYEYQSNNYKLIYFGLICIILLMWGWYFTFTLLTFSILSAYGDKLNKSIK